MNKEKISGRSRMSYCRTDHRAARQIFVADSTSAAAPAGRPTKNRCARKAGASYNKLSSRPGWRYSCIPYRREEVKHENDFGRPVLRALSILQIGRVSECRHPELHRAGVQLASPALPMRSLRPSLVSVPMAGSRRNLTVRGHLTTGGHRLRLLQSGFKGSPDGRSTCT